MYKKVRTTFAIAFVLTASSFADAQVGIRGGIDRPECSLPDDPSNGAYRASPWPKGVVPYRFHANVTLENQQRAVDAMAEIEAVCNVDFVPLTSQTAYLFIQASDVNNSCIGYSGGVCTVNIHDWAFKGVIIHEFGHSLGLHHEHQRPDRDMYVQVNTANICGGTGIVPLRGTPFGPYDFESVMHYSRRADSRDGSETISVRPEYAEWKYFCGQRDHLSNGDIWMLTHLYSGARPPRSFSQLSPAHRAQVGAGWTPSFEWGAAELADSYHLQVDDDPHFASPEIEVSIAATMYTAESPLPDGDVYYWRVLAVNANGETEARPRSVHMFLTESVTPSVLYVDDSSPPGEAGASWESAMRELGDALALAECSAGQVAEIRVAQGVYKPDRGTGDRDAAFNLAGAVQVKGGYAGIGMPDPDVRDIELHPTVLSGDLAGDDQPGFVNYVENSRHVVAALGISPACTLDGLTITAGNADGAWQEYGTGGGVWSRDSHVIMTDCRVTLCSAYLVGGGVQTFDNGSLEARRTLFENNRTTWPTYGYGNGAGLNKGPGAAVTLVGCTFRGNTGFQGAGANFTGVGACSVSDCLFEGNVATQWSGGMQVYLTPTVVVDRCTFRGNMALSAQEGYAGAYGNYGITSCSVRTISTLTNCLFEGNTGWTGGAINNDDTGTVNVINCTIVGNTAAPGRGGGIANTSDFGGSNVMIVRNSIVRGSTGGQIVNIGAGSSTSANYSNVEGGFAGIGNINADPMFVDATMGNFRLAPRSLSIDAGSNAVVPAGILIDIAGDPRFHDDPWTADTGASDPARPALARVDMGAHEFQGSSCAADFNDDAALNSQDFFDFLGAFFENDTSADFNADTFINSQDFFDFVGAFFAGC